MAAAPPPLDQFPPDLLQAVERDAADDADRVGQFLDALGLRPTGPGAARAPLRLPTFFLLRLGAALRLREWEQRGLRAHRDAGLPPADEALREVFRAAEAPEPLAAKEQAATQLAGRVLAVFAERMAWDGRPLLGADLELGEADEDALVDALAKFLWAHRHDGEGAGPTNRGRP
jgi:hypothetical protein